jgi:hypothetical protein
MMNGYLQCLRAKKHNNVVISTQKQYYSINQCMVTAITVNYSYELIRLDELESIISTKINHVFILKKLFLLAQLN